MKDIENIDYNSKILNFLAMTETGDPEVATKYLESSNWDEAIAVNNFYNKIKVNSNQNQIQDNIINNKNINTKNNNKNNTVNKINEDNSNNNIIKEKIDLNLSNDINQNLIDKNINNNININTDNNNQNFFNKYIIDPIISLFRCCCKKKEEFMDKEENKFYQLLPNTILDFTQFCESIKNKIGLIILYKRDNIQFLNKFINQLAQNSLLLNTLKEKCVIFCASTTSDEGIISRNTFNTAQFVYPIFSFAINFPTIKFL